MNDIGNITQDSEVEKRRRHGLQVLWRCKKQPGFIEREREKLGLLDAVNFQGYFLSQANFRRVCHSQDEDTSVRKRDAPWNPMF